MISLFQFIYHQLQEIYLGQNAGTIGQQYLRRSHPILEKPMRLAVCDPLQFISQELHWAIIVFRIAEDSKTKLWIRKDVVMQVQNKLLNVSTGTQRDGPCVHIDFRWADLGNPDAILQWSRHGSRITGYFLGFPQDALFTTNSLTLDMCTIVSASL